jgi:hypothetical protein
MATSVKNFFESILQKYVIFCGTLSYKPLQVIEIGRQKWRNLLFLSQIRFRTNQDVIYIRNGFIHHSLVEWSILRLLHTALNYSHLSICH